MKIEDTNWRKYEKEVHKQLTNVFKDCHFELDDWIFGKYSRIDRQIDISIRGTIGGDNVLGIIDCKFFNKKIDVEIVEKFLGTIEDTKANFGILITNKGYSKAAIRRSLSGNLKLDIIEFNHLEKLQLTYDYLLNKKIKSIELSKFEFFRRGQQNTAWFDSTKSNYKKRLIIFKEGYANTEYYVYKKMLECSARWFRDFTEINTIILKIPLIIKDDNYEKVIEKRIYTGKFNRNEIESFFEVEFIDLKENIKSWRREILGNKKFNSKEITDFIIPKINFINYENYDSQVK